MIDKWKKIQDLIEYPKEGILSKHLIKDKLAETTLFCMAKETDMSEHTSTKQGFVYVVEGKGSFNLEGKEIPMIPGTIIHLTKNAVHSLKADENTSFLLSLHK